jgi:hypothetical protein
MEIFKPATKSWLSSLAYWLCDGYWPIPGKDLPVTFQGSRNRYTMDHLLALGDVADIHYAHAESDLGPAAEARYLLKVSRSRGACRHLDRERETLAKLWSATRDTHYGRYLPRLSEYLPVSDTWGRRANVFHYQPGFRTLDQVREQYAALDGRHLAWIFKRLLTVLGFSHRQDAIHGAVFPCHVLIQAASHGLQLVGWGQSVERGRRITIIPGDYQRWYPPEVLRNQPASPATDLFLAARCLVYVAGGDPETNRMPNSVPQPMQRFFATCLLERARMRPDDAWLLLEEFDELLLRLYGAPKFEELTLT